MDGQPGRFNIAKKSLRCRLINLITLELICLAILLIYINIAMELWAISMVLIMGSLGMLSNLLLLERTKNVELCGNVITGIAFLMMITCNYFMGGALETYIGWFVGMPVIAAVTLGIPALMLYAPLSLIMILVFNMLDMTPLYKISYDAILPMNIVNLTFPLAIASTTLYFLLRENQYYESLLREHNLLLLDEKERLEYLSRYDALTNLPNRSYFNTHLESLMETVSPRERLTILFMDLDAMKPINDNLGHEAGDTLLHLTAKRLKSCLRQEDFLARQGGDEFTAIIRNGNKSKLPIILVQRILQAFDKPFVIQDQSVHSGISIGLAVFPNDGKTAEDLLKAADMALYAVKKNGKHNYKYYVPADKAKPSELHDLR